MENNIIKSKLVIMPPTVKNESNLVCLHNNPLHYFKICEFAKTEFCNDECIWHKDHKKGEA